MMNMKLLEVVTPPSIYQLIYIYVVLNSIQNSILTVINSVHIKSEQ